MISKQQKLLNRALGIKYKFSKRSSWMLKDESFVQTVKHSLPVIGGKAIDNDMYISTLIKKEDNRHVFRIDSQNDSNSYIFKVFPLCCLRHRFKYHHMTRQHGRFAYGEAIALLKASAKGIRVPEVYGYGTISGRSNLIKKSILIIECLSHHTPIGDLLELNSHDQGKCLSILKRSIPLYVQLYSAACNHISVNSGAIMFDDQGRSEEDYLLDFEYARFYSTPSYDLLMYEMAILARYCKSWVTMDIYSEWVDELLDSLEVYDSHVRKKLISQFNYYFETQLTRKERIKIGAS
jgi:hypothetical protein